jgi:glutathione S-transferase
MRIYHREGTGRPVRVAWTLEELDVPYEVTRMDREEGKGDDHRRRHPLGRVPVLEDGDQLLYESGAICMQLADIHPEAGLLPPVGSAERGLAYQWVCFAPAEIEPPLFETWMYAEHDPERSAKARKRFDAAAGAVHDQLDGAEFLAGDRFTVADIMVATALLFTVRPGFFDELSPRLKEYVGRLRERPAFGRAAKRALL